MGTFKIQKSASSEPDQNVEITVPEMNDTRKNFALKDQQRNGNFVCDCPYEICGQKRFYNIILYYIRFDELSYGFNAMMAEVETMKRNVFLIAEPKSSLKEHKKTFNEEKRKFLDFMFESNLDRIGIYYIYISNRINF